MIFLSRSVTLMLSKILFGGALYRSFDSGSPVGNQISKLVQASRKTNRALVHFFYSACPDYAITAIFVASAM